MPEGGGPFSPVELLGVLVDHEMDFILIGGLAATIHGSPSATVDVDIVPRRERSNLEHLAERAQAIDIGGVIVRVAALEDIIRSKEAANREKDRVVLTALRRLLERTGEKRPDVPSTPTP